MPGGVFLTDKNGVAVDATNALPVSASFSPSGTQDVNLTKVAGAAVSQGNGTAATAIRVSLPTDGTGVVGLIAGAAIIGKVSIDQTTPGTTNLVALANNQSVNNAQVNGVTVSVGNGVSGTGVQRVTLASDSTGQVVLAAGAAVIGALTANQSVNNAQINGVTPLMGNGASGTGAQRVTIASDSTGQVALAAGSAVVGVVGNTQGSTTSGQSGPLVQGAVITANPTYTTAQTSPLSLTTAGALRTDRTSVAGTVTSVNAGTPDAGSQRVAVALPTDGTITGSPPPSLTIGGWLATSGASQAVRMGATGAIRVSSADAYPYDASSGRATPVTATSGNVAAASAAATLAATASVTNYITGFQVTASGATAGLPVIVTVVGVITGTMSYIFTFPAGVLVGAVPLVVAFNPPVPASAANVAIVVTCPSGGSGNTNASVNVQGYRI